MCEGATFVCIEPPGVYRVVCRLEEREQLVEVQYLESCAYLSLSNLPRARAALFAAKTTANSTYVPPSVQVPVPTQLF